MDSWKFLLILTNLFIKGYKLKFNRNKIKFNKWKIIPSVFKEVLNWSSKVSFSFLKLWRFKSVSLSIDSEI